MNRKIKALGLAFVAALALTAVMASTASANFTSTAFDGHTILHGVKKTDHKFTAGVGIGAITCENVTFEGTTTSNSVSTVTIKPIYGPTCKDSLGRVVHVVTNTLEYHFLTPHTKHAATGKYTGNVTLTGHIELTVTTGFGHCTIKINGHQTVNGVEYTNNGNHVTVRTNSNNITSTIAGGGFACGTSATHSATGEYISETTLSGKDTNGNVVDLQVH